MQAHLPVVFVLALLITLVAFAAELAPLFVRIMQVGAP
jgi:hypothetical protein